MAIDLKKTWDSAIEILKIKESFDFEEHLKSIQISSVRAKLLSYLKFIKLVFESYEYVINELNEIKDNDEIVKLRLLVLRTALHGGADEKGLKYGLDVYFQHGEFNREQLNRKMFAEFMIICINLMSNEIPTPDNSNLNTTNWSPNAIKYFDKNYILSELLEVPNNNV